MVQTAEHRALSDFVEPTSIRDAQRRLRVLGSEIESIQCQLNEGRSDLEGRDAELWRHKANVAKTYKVREIQMLKQWLEDRQEPRPVVEVTTVDLTKVLTGRTRRLVRAVECARSFIASGHSGDFDRMRKAVEDVEKAGDL